MTERRPALSKRVTLRLPEATAEVWRQRADVADLSLSDWLRSAVDGKAATQTGQRRQRRRLRTLTADPALLRQLAATGNNVNQIARRVNGLGLDASDVTGVLIELAAIQRELHRLAELPRYDPEDDGTEEGPCT